MNKSAFNINFAISTANIKINITIAVSSAIGMPTTVPTNMNILTAQPIAFVNNLNTNHKNFSFLCRNCECRL